MSHCMYNVDIANGGVCYGSIWWDWELKTGLNVHYIVLDESKWCNKQKKCYQPTWKNVRQKGLSNIFDYIVIWHGLTNEGWGREVEVGGREVGHQQVLVHVCDICTTCVTHKEICFLKVCLSGRSLYILAGVPV